MANFDMIMVFVLLLIENPYLLEAYNILTGKMT